MIWQAKHHEYPSSSSSWTVDEVNECGKTIREIVDCWDNAELARRIARACNAHDDLLKACKALLTALGEGQIDKRSQPFGERITYVKILRAAITKAEDEEVNRG
jgi:hypothetical protein